MKFGAELVGEVVTLVFGNGIPALTGKVIAIHVDYLYFNVSVGEDEVKTYHVPLASIVYARL
jgi:hypothetical protein